MLGRLNAVWVMAGLLAAGIGGTARAAQPVFEWIEPLSGGQFSEARGVSGDGNVVVGLTIYVAGGRTEAFRYVNGTATGLGDLWGGTQSSVAVAASSDGSVVAGNTVNSADGKNRGFTWSDGTMTGLRFLSGGTSCEVYGVSGDGTVVVGSATTPEGSGTQTQWVRWVNGEVSVVEGGSCEGISRDGSVIVGMLSAMNDGRYQAGRWAGSWTALPDPEDASPYLNAAAFAASQDGDVIAGQYALQPCRWTEGLGYMLGTLSGSKGREGRATAVSADGSIIVGWADAGGTDIPYTTVFIWDADHGMRVLQDVLADEYGQDLSGASLKFAVGISADGKTIVGTGLKNGAMRGWVCRLGQVVTYTLATQVQGLGGIQVDPNTATFAAGTVVHLTAVALPGWHFSNWSGDIGGTDFSGQVTMDADRTVTAVFSRDTTSSDDQTKEPLIACGSGVVPPLLLCCLAMCLWSRRGRGRAG